MMTVKIVPNEKGNPPGKLADVDLHFTDTQIECPDCEGTRTVAITLAGGDHRFDDCPSCQGEGTVAHPLTGLKLIGFAIWERRGGGGRNVTFPARQYSVNGERRSFALLRPIADTTAQDAIRNLILRAYEDFEALQQAEPIGPPTKFAQDLADAIRTAPPLAEAPFSLTPTATTVRTVQPGLLK
jgi:hypothetical protein